MTLQEIFSDQHLLLPKAIPVGETYRDFIKDLFEKYIDILKEINPSIYQIEGLKKNVSFSRVIKIQEEFINGLLETIDIYFDGQPAKSYSMFENTIDFRKGKYKKILNFDEFDLNENFYRIRKKEENFPLSAFEMFHIPFESRGKVSTQRYSIPGFPSLYLAKTLYTAWEEMNRPNINGFQAVRLTTQKSIRFLDLTTNYWGDDNQNKTAYKYLMTWPLIAACSIRVSNYDDNFKPEYIIPQLLLQWVRTSGDIDGIKYDSTHITKKELKETGDIYNLVLPVKENKDAGYCDHLMSLFHMTETVSKQLMDYSTGGQIFLYRQEELNKINDKIPFLEIIKGQKTLYSSSILGHMEMILDKMKTKSLKV